jgi:chromosome segregation ATPase
LERDKVLSNVRNQEAMYISEINALKKFVKDSEEEKNVEHEKAEELQQKTDDFKLKLQETTKRNQDLQARCNELSKQCQRERKLR